MIAYLLQGFALGATAAVQPGPFQAFLLSLVARQGWQRALPAAFAPLLSDGPVLFIVLALLTRLPDSFLTALQLAGGAFLLYLAWGAWRAARLAPSLLPDNAMVAPPATRENVAKAALTNALSPSPYLFWATVAGPILLAAWRHAPAWGVAFLFSFYLALIGGMALFILFFGGAGTLHPRVNRLLGVASAVALFGFGLFQLATGATRTGIV